MENMHDVLDIISKNRCKQLQLPMPVCTYIHIEKKLYSEIMKLLT